MGRPLPKNPKPLDRNTPAYEAQKKMLIAIIKKEFKNVHDWTKENHQRVLNKLKDEYKINQVDSERFMNDFFEKNKVIKAVINVADVNLIVKAESTYLGIAKKTPAEIDESISKMAEWMDIARSSIQGEYNDEMAKRYFIALYALEEFEKYNGDKYSKELSETKYSDTVEEKWIKFSSDKAYQDEVINEMNKNNKYTF